MRKALGIAFVLSAAFVALCSASAAPPAPSPSPDQMAWQVFVTMTVPANKPGAKAVAFETWASDTDIFSTAPPHWPGAPKKRLLRSLTAAAEDHAMHLLAAAPTASCYPKGR